MTEKTEPKRGPGRPPKGRKMIRAYIDADVYAAFLEEIGERAHGAISEKLTEILRRRYARRGSL